MLLLIRRRSALQQAVKHVIIDENRYFSFADAGLIEEYNSDFLSLKEGKGLKPERNRVYPLALKITKKLHNPPTCLVKFGFREYGGYVHLKKAG